MLENRVITVQEVRIGDELLFAANGQIACVKVICEPKLSVKKDWRGNVKYSAVKVKCNIKKETHQQGTYTWESKSYECMPGEYNTEKYFNMNYKQMWLLERERYGN